MGLRFAILKKIENEEQVVLEYRDDQILSRLQARVRENLNEKETFLKHSFSKDEMAKALDKAYADLLVEFKEETVKLK